MHICNQAEQLAEKLVYCIAIFVFLSAEDIDDKSLVHQIIIIDFWLSTNR